MKEHHFREAVCLHPHQFSLMIIIFAYMHQENSGLLDFYCYTQSSNKNKNWKFLQSLDWKMLRFSHYKEINKKIILNTNFVKWKLTLTLFNFYSDQKFNLNLYSLSEYLHYLKWPNNAIYIHLKIITSINYYNVEQVLSEPLDISFQWILQPFSFLFYFNGVNNLIKNVRKYIKCWYHTTKMIINHRSHY